MFYPASLYVPWPLLLPVRTFFKMEGGDSEFTKFTLLTLKTFFKAHSQNFSGNKQQRVARAIGCPKTSFFFSFSTNSRFSGQPKSNVKTLFFHPPSPFPCNLCNCNSGGICTILG